MNITTDEIIEGLVGAAKLDVAFNHNRIVALHQRVKKFVSVNIHISLQAFLERISLEHLGDRFLCRYLNQLHQSELLQPFAVMPDFELLLGSIEYFSRLLEIRLRIRIDLLGREHRPGRVLAGRIANPRSVVADD